MTQTPVRAPSFIEYAARAVEFTERLDLHTASECSPNVADTMATVTPPDSITWTGCYAWAAPAPRADGTLQMSLSTDYEAVAGFYAEGKEVFNLKSSGHPLSRFTTPWYGFFESTADLDIFSSGGLTQDWVLFAPLDGPSGITGEIAWGKFDHRLPDPSVTDNDRAARHVAYVQALRDKDVDGVLATLSDDVVGAGRDYTGTSDPCFVPVNGVDAARAYYDAFFATFDVVDVVPITLLMRGWYLFSELAWTVTRRDVARGPRLSFVTGDIHVLDTDGRTWAKAGFGTPLEPAE